MIGSLFSGIGGIELGLESCGLGPVLWQCDSDPHARAVLETNWPSVHRYNDVREIDATAPPPEIICGGFPCQDISLAGKGVGIEGERSGLWSEFARIIRALRPSVVFVENVAALVNRGLDRVLGDLAALGFDAEWDVFRASDVGAPHRRERLFLLAYSDSERVRQLAERGPWRRAAERATECEHAESVHDRETLADAVRGGFGASEWDVRAGAAESGRRDRTLPDANRLGCEGLRGGESPRPWRPNAAELRARDVADPNGNGRESLRRGGLLDGAPRGDDSDRRHRAHRFPPGPAAISGWDGPQPAIRRGDDGVPGRSHRLRLLGNSVVPQVAALAWRTLIERAARAEDAA